MQYIRLNLIRVSSIFIIIIILPSAFTFFTRCLSFRVSRASHSLAFNTLLVPGRRPL